MILSCFICKNNFEGKPPQMCCDGRECGCMGQSIEQSICSDECYWKFVSKTMNNKELIKRHVEDTKFCSFPNHMRTVSSTYKEIISRRNAIIPDIILYLKENNVGMDVILLLEDITNENPITPEKILVGFVGYDVAETKEAWIKWFEQKQLK